MKRKVIIMENNENLQTMQEQAKNTSKVQSTKTAIYKKWWFWIIIGALAIAIISGGSNDSNSGDGGVGSSLSGNGGLSENIWKTSGTYKVGDDIEAGEYFVKCTSYNCYIETSSDSRGTLDSIIANDNFSTHTYITVRDGEYLTVNGGKFALAEKIEPQKANSDGSYGEGMYKVGKDIPAGEYKIVATNSCYIEVSSNSNHTFNSIISNDNIEVGTSTYITVSDGQYLKVNGGKIVAQ